MKNWTVYKHVSPSGKVYIGISSNVKNRWAANGYYYHLSDTAFSRALKKYGWDNFQHVILTDGLTKEEACNIEVELIAYYKAKGISYNITNGGEGRSGKHSKEQIKHRVESRIANNSVDYLVIDKNFNYIICQTEREAAEYLGGIQRNISHVLKQPIGYTFKKHYIWKHEKGTPVDIDTIKEKIQEALRLRKQKQSEAGKLNGHLGSEKLRSTLKLMTPEERKAKYGHGEKRIGKHHSEETKRKMSEKAKGRDMHLAIEAAAKKRNKKIIQILNGMEINTFDSIKEASRILRINSTNISECARGRRKTAGGYSWKFKLEREEQYVGRGVQ